MNFSFDLKFGNGIIGVDEAGRGCLAGPVFAAAIILDQDNFSKEINDSKKLSIIQRMKIFKELTKKCEYSIGIASVKEIEKFNILQSSLLAMNRALKKINIKNHIILIDGNFSPDKNKNIKTIVKGDQKCISIAAASIIAKVSRDLFMAKLSIKFPNYNWEKNCGYGTKKHLEAIKEFGITEHHRKTFFPIHNLLIK
jgi:ribonuclease HII